MTDQGLAASTGGADARTRTNVAIWAAMLVIGALEVTVTYRGRPLWMFRASSMSSAKRSGEPSQPAPLTVAT